MTIPSVSPHIAELKKLFLALLDLQLNVGKKARFHLLLETEDDGQFSSRYTSVNLLSLFSSSLSAETPSRREGLRELGELLVDFKLLSLKDGDNPVSQPTVHGTGVQPQRTIDLTAAPFDDTNSTEHRPDSTTLSSETTVPPSLSVNKRQPDEPEDDNDGLNSEWFTAPSNVMDLMKLPDWFPSPDPTITEDLKKTLDRSSH